MKEKIILVVLFFFISGCETVGYTGSVIAYVPKEKVDSLRSNWISIGGFKGPTTHSTAPDCRYYVKELKRSGMEASVMECFEQDKNSRRESRYIVAISAGNPHDLRVQKDIDEITEKIDSLIRNYAGNTKVIKSTGTYRRGI